MGKTPKVDRRKFMEIGIYTITGTIAATSSVALARFSIGNSLVKPKSKWIEVDIDEEPDEEFSRVVIEYRKKDGWLTSYARGLVYLKKSDKGEWVAISATCSHLGCIVTWNQEDKTFDCPCHDGKYDAQGRVISGPPPAALQRHKTKIEEGVVLLSTETIAFKGDHDETV